MYHGIGYSVASRRGSFQPAKKCNATEVSFLRSSAQAVRKERAIVRGDWGRVRQKRKRIEVPSVSQFRNVQPFLYSSLIASVQKMKLKKARTCVEESERSTYLVVRYNHYSVPITIRFCLMRAFVVAKSIGGVRNYIRGRYANSRGETCLYLPTKGYPRKPKLTRPQVISQIVSRISKRTKKQRAEDVNWATCNCHKLYFPEFWPTGETYRGVTQPQYGAFLRWGTSLQLPGDQERIWSATDKDPSLAGPLPKKLLYNREVAWRRKFNEKIFVIDKNNRGGAQTLVDHGPHIAVPHYLPLSFRYRSTELEQYDEEWAT